MVLSAKTKFSLLLLGTNLLSLFISAAVVAVVYQRHCSSINRIEDAALVHRQTQDECCSCEPTFPPINPTPAPIPAPIPAPTSAPNNNNGTPRYTCPSGDLATLTLGETGGTTVEFQVSNTLCTLVLLSSSATTSDSLQPVARSYLNHSWEASAGKYDTITFDCTTTAGVCSVVLPESGDAVYQLTSFDMPLQYNNNDDVAIARFLEQATFGPTKGDMATFAASDDVDFATWVLEQQSSSTISSHRAFFRKHLNARISVATPQGAVTHPCSEGARYRRYAFTFKDRNKMLTIETIPGTTKKTLTVDGFVRTVVNGPIHWRRDASAVYEDGTYQIMWTNPNMSQLGYFIFLEHPTHGIKDISWGGVDGNPPIQFDSGIDPNVLLTLVASVAPIDSQYFGGDVQEVILTSDSTQSACNSLGEAGNPLNPVFAFYNGQYWMHDSRFDTVDNTVESPAMDGGGQAVRDTANVIHPELAAVCSNAPRTFVNQDDCVLSFDPTACDIGTRTYEWQEYEGDLPDFYLQLTPETLRAFYTVTSTTEDTRYVYAIDGLRSTDDVALSLWPPCRKGAQSRWLQLETCTGDAESVDPTVHSIFQAMLTPGPDPIRDIWKWTNDECPAEFYGDFDFEIKDTSGKCWLNIHPDQYNVYDFTIWTRDHDGNLPPRNPIKEFAEAGNTTLLFPDWHPMDRWQNRKQLFGAAAKLYDWVHFYQLPSELRSIALSEHFGFTADAINYTPSNGVLVCGSPNEVANDPMLGGSVGVRGAFDSFIPDLRTTETDDFVRQKRIAWTQIALEAPDQLRQRVAWALSQILVVSPMDDKRSEDFANYYDIFVRHAFGNYRNVLKEVAYSPIMARMLTYWRSQSTGFTWKQSGNVEFADENFAREIMQLFSTGLVHLNMDGTEVLDDNGDAIRVYSNDDIMEYARVWTGFGPQPLRGNMEQFYANHIDPMTIDMDLRDRFPKMGLDRTYIGDYAPLCRDLPQYHFLLPGAEYRLLARSPSPEWQAADPDEWRDATNANRFSLQTDSPLFAKLCGTSNAASCTYPARVVLDATLICKGLECDVDTLRTVEVGNGIFYEYIRPPCVYQAFFDDAKTVVRRNTWWDLTCADPRGTQIASAACCLGDTKVWNDKYWGERLSFETAQDRCGADNLCSRSTRPYCDETYCADNNHHWTNDPCTVQAKIDGDGKVAIVHAPQPDIENRAVNRYVQQDTATFFRVDWSGGDSKTLFETCDSVDGCSTFDDGMCICNVAVSEEQAFSSTPSRDEILNSLSTGAFNPTLSGFGAPTGSTSDVAWYSSDGALNQDTVFEVTDDMGIVQFRKNLKSTVSIVGTGLSFRNPVHYISLTEPELRDAHFETDEALDHYMRHKNTAPFLAIRLAQRFGISNPSPRYVKAIAGAFISGSYTFESDVHEATEEFGSGQYGDLAAAVACVLLDREARSLILDADPSHGSLREPLIKLIGLMRSLDFTLFGDVPFVDFANEIEAITGQMAHALPNVFSFFLPEFQPSGPVERASLTAPEAQLLTGPRVVDTMNGILSLIKFGLTKCFSGLAIDKGYNRPACDAYTLGGNNEGSLGKMNFLPDNAASSQAITDELATLLTAGRLSVENRQVIDQVVDEEPDPTLKLIKAQQLMVFAPEFHSTNVARRSGETRPAPPAKPPTTNSYKAVVYVLLEGGMDSFNMLAPHECTEVNPDGKTLLEQYNSERTSLAITNSERSRPIDATGQPCSKFVVHEDLSVVERLYKDGDLAFFANAGVLNRPSDKENYSTVTRTQLFAHNTMMQEAQKIDPFDGKPGTGMLGRMCDVLSSEGFNAQPITIEDATVATVGVPGAGVDPLIVSPHGTNEFSPRPEFDTFDPKTFIEQLNDATELQSSLYGETWSKGLQSAIRDNEALLEALSSSQVTTPFPDHRYSDDLKAVSALVSSHEQRRTDRDVFFVSMSGWDHHNDMKDNLSDNFQDLNGALGAFEAEMKAQGRWNDVTLVITSDFGRTLTANSGEGSDHAWGGNYFTMGGSVKGGQIHGEYPSDITFASPLNIGRGRLIPTMSWESIFNSVLQWMDVPDSQLDYCLPNRFDAGAQLLTKTEVFD